MYIRHVICGYIGQTDLIRARDQVRTLINAEMNFRVDSKVCKDALAQVSESLLLKKF